MPAVDFDLFLDDGSDPDYSLAGDALEVHGLDPGEKVELEVSIRSANEDEQGDSGTVRVFFTPDGGAEETIGLTVRTD